MGAARPADDPMMGDWKLNPQKSKLTHEMTVTRLGGNKYSFDFGGGNPETIVVHGTDQPASFGSTFQVTEVSPDEWRRGTGVCGRLATMQLGRAGFPFASDPGAIRQRAHHRDGDKSSS